MFTPRFVRIAVWVLAVILPGGLFMLALWASARAVRARYLARTEAPALQLPSLPPIASADPRQCTARS